MTRYLVAEALSFVAVPWNAFVGAFLYYAVLTVIAVGVSQLSDAFMAIAYLAPVAAYAGLLLVRAAQGLARLPAGVGAPRQGLLF